jgi:hypothetical protein
MNTSNVFLLVKWVIAALLLVLIVWQVHRLKPEGGKVVITSYFVSWGFFFILYYTLLKYWS